MPSVAINEVLHYRFYHSEAQKSLTLLSFTPGLFVKHRCPTIYNLQVANNIGGQDKTICP